MINKFTPRGAELMSIQEFRKKLKNEQIEAI